MSKYNMRVENNDNARVVARLSTRSTPSLSHYGRIMNSKSVTFGLLSECMTDIDAGYRLHGGSFMQLPAGMVAPHGRNRTMHLASDAGLPGLLAQDHYKYDAVYAGGVARSSPPCNSPSCCPRRSSSWACSSSLYRSRSSPRDGTSST